MCLVPFFSHRRRKLQHLQSARREGKRSKDYPQIVPMDADYEANGIHRRNLRWIS